MKAHIESTAQIVYLNGLPARVWIGATEHGIPIQLAIMRVAVSLEADHSQFERELESTHAPVPEHPAFSLRMVL